jgi:radical SAM protein with 4Fe4S-binding SPASM domain
MFKRLRNSEGEYPRLVAVETTSRCNAECPFCPYNVRARAKEHMTDQLFEKIIEECREFPLPAIEPFLNGEPFVDPKIMDRLEHIRSRLPDTKLRVYSNGYALAPKRVDQLVGMGIDRLYISLNTLNPDKYKAVMGFELKRTLENVKYMCDPSRRSKIANKITLRMTRMSDTTLQEQDEFATFCKEQGVECMIAGLFNYKGDINSTLPVPSYGCEHVTRLDILSNGNVTLCCMDQEGTYTLGNANDNTVLELYRGAAASKYREYHHTGRRKEIEPCGTCNLYWPTLDGQSWPRAIKTSLEAWWYFRKYQPTGRKEPPAPQVPCEEHAAKLPDVTADSLKRKPLPMTDDRPQA